MTREEMDFIGSMNMCDEISNEAYQKIMAHCEEQEPCENCVSRQAVLDVVNFEDEWLFDAKSHNADTKIAFSAIKSKISEIPFVTPQPKTGHWIRCDILQELKCSECRRCFRNKTNYCPNCGAKMEGRKKVDQRRSKGNS